MNTNDPLQNHKQNDDEDVEEIHILVLRKNRDRRKLDIHHVRPTSRGGTDDAENLCVWHRAFHQDWHHLFTNMTLKEIHTFIDMLHTPGEVWNKQRIREVRDAIIDGKLDKSPTST